MAKAVDIEQQARISAEILAKRAELLAVEPPKISLDDKSLSVISFNVRGQKYGLDSSCVSSIVSIQKITPVPFSADYVLGVVNVRGRLVMVIDLLKRLSISVSSDEDWNNMLILGEGDAEFAIAATGLEQLVQVGISGIAPPPESIRGIVRKYLCGITEDLVLVLDGRAMLDDPSLYANSNYRKESSYGTAKN